MPAPINPAAILIPAINKKILSYLLWGGHQQGFSYDVRQLAAVNKVFATSVTQLIAETETKYSESEDCLKRLLQFKRLEKNPLPLGLNILDRKTLSSEMRLNFIDYFLNNQNECTKSNLNFLSVSCNIPELFPLALPILFRKLKRLGNEQECKTIFNNIMHGLNSKSYIDRLEAIQNISTIFVSLNLEQKNLVCEKFYKYIKQLMHADSREDFSSVLLADIVKVVTKILPSMELFQRVDVARIMVEFFDTAYNDELREHILRGLMELLDSMGRQQKIAIFAKVSDFMARPKGCEYSLWMLINGRFIPSVFDKMDRQWREQTFEKIVCMLCNNYIMLPSKVNVISNILHKIGLPQQLKCFDMLLRLLQSEKQKINSRFILATITPELINKLDATRKAATFKMLMEMLSELDDDKQLYTNRSCMRIMIAPVFKYLNLEQKTQLFKQAILLTQNKDVNVRCNASDSLEAMCASLEEIQYPMAFDELIKLLYLKSNDSYMRGKVLLAVENIILKNQDEHVEKCILNKMVALLNENSPANKMFAIQLLIRYLDKMEPSIKEQVISALFTIYSCDDYAVRLEMPYILPEIFLKMDQHQQEVAFNLLAEYTLKSPHAYRLIHTFKIIFYKLSVAQQMQTYETLVEIISDNPSEKTISAFVVISDIVNKIPLDEMQIQKILALTLRYFYSNDAYGELESTLPAFLPKLLHKIQVNPQQDELLQNVTNKIVETLLSITETEMTALGSTSICALIEIYPVLTAAQKQLVYTRIIDLLATSSVMPDVISSLAKIFNMLEPEVQGEIRNTIMSEKCRKLFDSVSVHKQSALLYCYTCIGGYSKVDVDVDVDVFPRTKLNEYIQEIEQSLQTKTTTNPAPKLLVDPIVYSWQSRRMQDLNLADQTRIDPVQNPLQLVRYRNGA